MTQRFKEIRKQAETTDFEDELELHDLTEVTDNPLRERFDGMKRLDLIISALEQLAVSQQERGVALAAAHSLRDELFNTGKITNEPVSIEPVDAELKSVDEQELRKQAWAKRVEAELELYDPFQAEEEAETQERFDDIAREELVRELTVKDWKDV